MATVRRRTAPEKPTISGRLGDILMNRRRAVAAARAERITVQRTNGGQVAELPDDIHPLTDVIQRASTESRPPRQTEYLHVSDILSKCIRKIALVEEHKIAKPSQRLSLMDMLTFSVGDTIHDVVKGRAAAGGPEYVWGNWACKCGTTKTDTPCLFSEVDHNATCPACRGHLTEYQELPMRDDALRIVGTPDLLMYLPDFDALYISELKSISHNAWEELVRPLPDHVIQVVFYWYLMKRAGYRIANKVSIFYVTKGYVFKGVPYKEFVIDAESQVGRLEPYLETARELVKYRKTKELPKRIMCASDRSPDARACEVCSICFGNVNAAPVKVSITKALRRQ